MGYDFGNSNVISTATEYKRLQLIDFTQGAFMAGQSLATADLNVSAAAFSPDEITAATARVRETLFVVESPDSGAVGVTVGTGDFAADMEAIAQQGLWVRGSLPPLYPEWLGDRSFGETHGVRFPYVVGEMANGIASPRMVIAAAKSGCVGFLGCAGLGPQRVEAGLDEIKRELDGTGMPWGANLIHSPQEPLLEERNVDLFLAKGVQRVSASAFMNLRSSIVRYAYHGLHVDASGRLQRPFQVLGKVSRPEVAAAFMNPAPASMLETLVAEGKLTAEEARLGANLPVAEDITAEADSGGHTDNRPLTVLLPVLCSLRDDLQRKYNFERPIRVGAAGGIGTPGAAAAAFGLGAAYVLTGSVNQSAVEAGVSEGAKKILAQADMADVTMAPAADMFELGVKVQVLKRGTMFASRAHRLYEVYRDNAGLDDLPSKVRSELEQQIFRASLNDIWAETKAFWQRREPGEVSKAETDPKHQMALVFRWYLGKASRWAIEGDGGRAIDYQLWCGPAMGSFNRWVKGSFLEPVEARTVEQIALNILEGAAVITRAQQLRTFGAPVAANAFDFQPRMLSLN